MRKAFADTLYFVAILLPGDEWRAAALEAAERLGLVQIVTTDEVLFEVMNTLAGVGSYYRRRTVAFVETLFNDPFVNVLSQSHETFLAGLTLYKNRPDKGYSLTDCVSMATMRREGITDVLTNDHHFEQEGFTVLI